MREPAARRLTGAPATQAVALLVEPANVELGIRLLLETADEIAHVCGDRSTDLSWYSHRLGLAALYASTEVVACADPTADLSDTQGYLRRRLAALSTLGQSASDAWQAASAMAVRPEALMAVLQTLRNLCGCGDRRR